ncbi:MAG: PAS domain S-box protein, partial [Gallionellaceae bacterium]|nr:PAS domain S-box protein [Gallionellaceae bacterium]
MKLPSLALRLAVWFMLATLLPLNLLSYLSLRESEDLLRQEALEQLSQQADRKLLEIRVYLGERSRDARILARSSLMGRTMPELVRAYTRYGPGSAEYRSLAKGLESELAAYIGESREGLYYDVLLVSPQGEIVYTQKREADFATSLASGPFSHTQLAEAFRKSIMTLESSYSQLGHYAPSGMPAIFVTIPVIREGAAEGVIALQLDPQQLYQIVMDGTGLGATGETALIRLTGDNEAAFATPLRSDPQAASHRAMNMKSAAAPVRNALSGQRGSGVELDYDGKQAAAAWRYLPELGWGLVVKMDASEVFAQLYQQRKDLMKMLVLLLIMVSLAALYAGRKLVWRIRGFAQKADEIAGGKLGERVSDSGADEIGALAYSFNRMADRLQTLYRTQEERIEERTRELNVTNEQLREEIAEREKYEQALQLYKNVIDISQDGFWIVDAQGYLQMANEAAANISGYPAEEMVRMHISQLEAIEKSVDDVKAHIEKIVAQSRDHFETRHRHKDGHEIDIEVTTTYLPETRQFAAFIRDISGRKAVQLELLHKQDLLNEAQRLGQLGSWELDLASGKMTWSDETYRIFELNPSQLLPFYESFLG